MTLETQKPALQAGERVSCTISGGSGAVPFIVDGDPETINRRSGV